MSRPDFSTRGRRPELEAGDVALLAAAAIALALAVGSAASAWTDLRRATADLDTARREAADAAGRARALEGRKGPDVVLSSRAFLTAEAPPPRVMADLESVLPGDVRLIALTLDYGERLDLGMQLSARHAASYDQFLQRLQQSPLFADIRPGEEVRDGGVRAQIQATYRVGR
jgi:hypothetical protein